MNKLLLLSMAALFSIFNASAQKKAIRPKGKVIEKTFDFKDFENIALEHNYDLRIIYATEYKVEIRGSENFIERLEVEQKKNTLHLNMQKGKYKQLDVEATVYMPLPKVLQVKGAGDMILDEFPSLQELTVQNLGSGNFYNSKVLDVKGPISLQIMGSGHIRLQGQSSTTICQALGSGDARLEAWQSKEHRCLIQGSGDIELGPCDKVNVDLKASGHLYYQGSPEIKQTTLGSGRIKRR